MQQPAIDPVRSAHWTSCHETYDVHADRRPVLGGDHRVRTLGPDATRQSSWSNPAASAPRLTCREKPARKEGRGFAASPSPRIETLSHGLPPAGKLPATSLTLAECIFNELKVATGVYRGKVRHFRCQLAERPCRSLHREDAVRIDRRELGLDRLYGTNTCLSVAAATREKRRHIALRSLVGLSVGALPHVTKAAVIQMQHAAQDLRGVEHSEF